MSRRRKLVNSSTLSLSLMRKKRWKYIRVSKKKRTKPKNCWVSHTRWGAVLFSPVFIFSSQRDGQADRKCFQHSQQQENKKIKYISRGNWVCLTIYANDFNRLEQSSAGNSIRKGGENSFLWHNNRAGFFYSLENRSDLLFQTVAIRESCIKNEKRKNTTCIT